jgi:DNA polymerase (family 10)
MSVHNAEIADKFNRLADLLEIQGANPYRVRSYRTAAINIDSMPTEASEMLEEGEDLSEIPGIGEDLAGKIEEIVRSGNLSDLQELEREVPAGLVELTNIEGLGPKHAKAIYEGPNVTGLKELENAAREGKIRQLRGFGPKTEERVLDEIERLNKMGPARIKFSQAEQLAKPLVEYLKEVEGVKRVKVAGSYRRKQETVGDLDMVVTHKSDSAVMDRFVEYEEVDRVVSQGKTRSSVLLRSGLQVDLRAVAEVSYGAALHYFTGSQSHTVALRKIAVGRNLKMNEYGVFKGDKRIAGKTEEDVYQQLGLGYIEPELRENRGEIELAQKGNLPKLVTLKEIRGDLHTHTSATDGRNTLEEMAQAALNRGCEYLAITDHTQRLTVAKGQDPKGVAKQTEKIDRLNYELDGIELLKGAEVDILEDGSLDLPDETLRQLDLIVVSVHYKFDLSREKQTARVIKAITSPYFTILGHPTGRLINEREPYSIDMEKVMEAARDNGCVLELNAQPDRLDMNDIYCKMAKEMGVLVAISTDAHSVHEMDYLRYGVAQARRGWLEADDVLNTRSLSQLRKLLKK